MSAAAALPNVPLAVNLATAPVVPVPVTGLVNAFCLLLKVVQSELLRQPVDVPDAPTHVTELLLRLSAPENVSGAS